MARVPPSTANLGVLDRHRSDPGLNVSGWMVAAPNYDGPARLILLVDIHGHELSLLGFHRLGNQLFCPSPNQRRQGITPSSIFLL